ncbi:uncharacterized protein EI97DRAFT_76282 [Westerdykella ornata]|uniref:rRNA-processing protein EFG1 n=1 Tax=Westerdykella ornata TaxID=318751 RepID=A0A6A6JGD1_WESOR|nr:uncharacterized protein EI97DRAFT_76282 [Westerdykella ornata]KAF2275472.1 hypothetical protein EI97DRAFT_76282 [Westerdykella ornata]
MSQKRKLADTADADNHARGPSKKKPFRPGKGHRKHKRQDLDQGEGKGPSISELKSRIRDLRRLLDHVESDPKARMPANVRIERERELEACQHELEEKTAAAQDAERRRHMISKYHHIRFFDRQKATRILKRLRRQLATETDATEGADETPERRKLLREIHDAEVAVNYAIYYPLMKRYIALYPKSKREMKNTDGESNTQEGNSENTAKGDPEMWAAVERAMEEGTLDKLRNSDDGSAGRRPLPKTKSHGTTKKSARENAKKTAQPKQPQIGEQEDDDSDGGFFE